MSSRHCVSSLPAVSATTPTRPLTPMQTQAALLLAQGRRQSDVGKLLQISHETICRWGRSPAFAHAVTEAQHELIESVRSWHLSLLGKAMGRLEALLDHHRARRYSC